MTDNITLEEKWDKTFPESALADHVKVTFRNRYGITLAADMYTPKNAGENAGYRRMRAFRRCKGAVFGALRPEDGRERIPHPGI